ncbi:MAG TPA: hypothetical protein VKH37_04110 [Ferruginibacter sp.]|nr:hypothetical protein [Ferruginibacter sp.]
MNDTYSRFEAKNNRNSFLFYLLFSSIPIAGISYSIISDPKKELAEFNKSPIFCSIFVALFLLFFGFMCYKYFFDKKVKLIVDKDCIWTSRYGQVQWQSVWYIFQQEIKGRINQEKLVIKLNEDDKELTLDTTYYDKTAEEILNALKEYSKGFEIQFLGFDIVGG